MNIEDMKALDIKDKLLVIKTEDVNSDALSKISQQLLEQGCLGVIILPTEAVIESLGLGQLKEIVKQIETRTDYTNGQKEDKNNG